MNYCENCSGHKYETYFGDHLIQGCSCPEPDPEVTEPTSDSKPEDRCLACYFAPCQCFGGYRNEK